jgi:catechol 2,3-dioxygenase-like lactoylglutathione lyase family enzyme
MAAKQTKSTIRMEGLTLAVKDVKRSAAFYGKKLGLKIEIDSAPHFALVRIGPGASIGLLAARHAVPKGIKPASKAQHAAIHVELSTDDLDGLYKRLKARGVAFSEPPHDEAWERSAQARDPDGYTIEFAQGRRGRNAPRT